MGRTRNKISRPVWTRKGPNNHAICRRVGEKLNYPYKLESHNK